MFDKIKSLGKQTFVYGMGSILNKMLGFALIPMYIKHIPIGNFGNLVYLETIIIFLSTFLNFGIGPAFQRFFHSERENKTYGVFLFNNFFGCFFLSLLAVLPMVFFSKDLAAVLCKDINQSGIFQIAMFTVVVEVLYTLPLYMLQYEEKPFQYLLFNVIKLILSFGLTIYFVIYASMGIQGVFLARLVGGGLTLLIALFVVVLPRSTFRINLKSIEKSIRFGFPMVISNIGYTLFVLSDRVMLNWLSTDEQVGKYGFGFRIANFINLIFVQTIGMSYFPSIMSNEKKSDNIRYYRKMLTYYSFLMGFLILGFLFFYKDLLVIVGKDKEYWEGLKVVPILAISFMIMGMNFFVGVGLFLKNQTKYYLIPSFSAVFVNFAMNLWLIPKLGMMGAAYSVVSAQIVYTSLLAYLSGKQLKIGFEWNKVFLIYVLAIALYGINHLLAIENFWLSSLTKLIILGIFPIILYKLKFFEQIEIKRLQEGMVKLLVLFKLR